MPKAVDLTGKIFGQLTVLERAGTTSGKANWLCQCTCGERKIVRGTNLTHGCTKSCGCMRNNILAKGRDLIDNYKHGDTEATEYIAWVKMRQSAFFIEKWTDYEMFLSDVGRKPSSNHSLQRKDCRKPHGPENTYWGNLNEQREERRELSLPDELCLFVG